MCASFNKLATATMSCGRRSSCGSNAGIGDWCFNFSPPGPQGVQGGQGAQGPQGSQGAQGSQGGTGTAPPTLLATVYDFGASLPATLAPGGTVYGLYPWLHAASAPALAIADSTIRGGQPTPPLTSPISVSYPLLTVDILEFSASPVPGVVTITATLHANGLPTGVFAMVTFPVPTSPSTISTSSQFFGNTSSGATAFTVGAGTTLSVQIVVSGSVTMTDIQTGTIDFIVRVSA